MINTFNKVLPEIIVIPGKCSSPANPLFPVRDILQLLSFRHLAETVRN